MVAIRNCFRDVIQRRPRPRFRNRERRIESRAFRARRPDGCPSLRTGRVVGRRTTTPTATGRFVFFRFAFGADAFQKDRGGFVRRVLRNEFAPDGEGEEFFAEGGGHCVLLPDAFEQSAEFRDGGGKGVGPFAHFAEEFGERAVVRGTVVGLEPDDVEARLVACQKVCGGVAAPTPLRVLLAPRGGAGGRVGRACAGDEIVEVLAAQGVLDECMADAGAVVVEPRFPRRAAATEEEMKVLIGKLGENMHVRRAVRWTTNGIIKEYKHHQGGPFYGVMVDLEGEYTDELAMDVCLHITANAPSYVTSKDVPEAVIAKEREIAAALPELQGKPEKILEGILRGKINKFFTTACLMDQPWINDEKTTLAKVAPKLVVKRFIRWQVGEEVK